MAKKTLADLSVNTPKPASSPAAGAARRSKPETKALYASITADAHRQLSVLALDSGQTKAELTADALNLLFRSRDLPEVA